MKLESPNFNIVLIEPEIPNNTGSIGRTCVGTACRLHLVGKLGFQIDEKSVKRAGLDYWANVDLEHHQKLQDVFPSHQISNRAFFFSKKASKSIFDVEFQRGDYFIFGKETTGLDDSLLREYSTQTVRIPIWGPIRSLNLSNAVSVVVYEGMRQLELISKISSGAAGRNRD